MSDPMADTVWASLAGNTAVLWSFRCDRMKSYSAVVAAMVS